MITGLFHKDVLAPKPVFKSPGLHNVRYSAHARSAAKSDKYGDLSEYLVESIDFDLAEIVEVEMADGVIVKRVVRVPITSEMVLVMVIQSNGVVRTVWGNLHKDKHTTLNKNLFIKRLEPVKWNALAQLLGD